MFFSRAFFDRVLKRNYQKVSTNRYVVDSPRFWRPELHPRFSDLFNHDDFMSQFLYVNDSLAFPFTTIQAQLMGTECYSLFAPHRFAYIPTKTPSAKAAFLADFAFAIADILPQIRFEGWKLIDDDFNLVTHRAEEDKVDTSKVATDENNVQNTKFDTTGQILSQGLLKQTSESDAETTNQSTLGQVSTANTDNTDDESNTNTKQANDVFLSPQNQGVTPNNDATKFEGVDGITLNGNGQFTTNTSNLVSGESTKSQSNVSGQSQSLEDEIIEGTKASQAQKSEDELIQNNDVTHAQSNDTTMSMGQMQQNTNLKGSNYIETLDFNRGARLQDFYDLNRGRLWNELFGRMSRWVLQVNIATSDTNYLDCPYYE